MINKASFKDTLFTVAAEDFNAAALSLFRYQAEACAPYQRFLKGLNTDTSRIEHWSQIPHLPIEAFKNHEVKSGRFEPEVLYTSSGTTGNQTSRHFVEEKRWYEAVFIESFKRAYGDFSEHQWLCLLPSYLERKGSSLIDMAAYFCDHSAVGNSGFYLNNIDELKSEIEDAIQSKTPTILLGVSFALLDFSERHAINLPYYIQIMETGGMKGRRKEMVRAELHQTLKDAFGVPSIHSEYGMTEMMSQAYSKGDGKYTSPPWMRVSLRDTADPLSPVRPGKTGGINIIDLANVDSCAFIATQDLGRLHSETTFEVLGRFDDSDVRGCNLMVL